jgi:SSS family solute:Na+ symporter
MAIIDTRVIDLTIIFIYLGITFFLSIWFGQDTKTLKEYAIGNRDYSTIVLVLTIVATWIDGGSTLAPSSNSFKYGIIALYPQLGIITYLYIVGRFIAPLIEPYLGFISVGEIMGDMYGKPARVVTGIIGAIRSFGHVSIQIYALSHVLSYLTPAPKFECMLISTVIIILFSTFGGINAVTFTDVFQSITIVIVIPLILIVALTEVGGIKNIINEIPSTHISLSAETDLIINYTFLFIYFCIPSLTPAAIQRMLMAKDANQIFLSFKLASMVMATFFICTVFLGLISKVLAPTIDSQYVFMFLIDSLMPPILKGIAICGILSIIMSTADSHLHVASVALSNDYLKILCNDFSGSTLLFISRFVSLCFGIICFFIAIKFNSLLDLVIYIDSFWFPIITPPLLLGLIGFRTSAKVFLIAACFGGTTFILCDCFLLFSQKSKVLYLIFGFIANSVSLVTLPYLMQEKSEWIKLKSPIKINSDIKRKAI